MKPWNEAVVNRERGISLALRMICATALACAAQAALAQQLDPKAVLKSMTDYVGKQQTIELTFDSDIEVITPQLEKIQFTNSGEANLSRPNRLQVHRVGGYSDVALYFDGNDATIFGKSANAYARFEAVGTVDELLEVLRAGKGIALPGSDLLLTNAYDVLVADVKEAKYMGRGVIDGVECEHLAFRGSETDWQLWVQLGNQPVPRKMVITSKTIASAPQYTIRVKDWKTGGELAPATFVFVPPEGMQELKPEQLIDLDELPQGVPMGEGE